jgi:hypothetical protein
MLTKEFNVLFVQPLPRELLTIIAYLVGYVFAALKVRISGLDHLIVNGEVDTVLSDCGLREASLAKSVKHFS